jgi:PIN domain nuclease of toxin-antitoxin system
VSKRYLLDTQALLLWRVDSPALSKKLVRLLQHENAELLLSSASVWEICIKRSLGKVELGLPTSEFVQSAIAAGVSLLDVRPDHLYRAEQLPFYHRDPFDRLLAAQAAVEGVPIVSKHNVFKKYGVKVLW